MNWGIKPSPLREFCPIINMKIREENISYFINLDKFNIHEPQISKYQMILKEARNDK